MHLNLCLSKIHITQKNVVKVLTIAKDLSQVNQTPVQRWQSPIGTLQAQATFIPLDRLKVRLIIFNLHCFWNQNQDSPNKLIPTSQSFKTLLKWWSLQQNLRQEFVLELTPFTHRLFTDASIKGWGAHLNNATCLGVWDRTESQLHIKNIEMRAVRIALSQLNIPPLSNVLVATDNTTVVPYTNKVGGTRSWSLWMETETFFFVVVTLNISISARFIPGKMKFICVTLAPEKRA